MAVYHDFTPPIPERTEYIEAGAVTIGVEPRVLTDGMLRAYPDNARVLDLAAIRGLMAEFEERGGVVMDSGVSIHVLGDSHGGLVEHLRFDCYHRRPHYHYYRKGVWERKLTISPEEAPVQMYIDTVADGEPLPWALERLRTRLPEMLAEAGAPELAGRVDRAEIEAAMPQVALAAERAQARTPQPG